MSADDFFTLFRVVFIVALMVYAAWMWSSYREVQNYMREIRHVRDELARLLEALRKDERR